MSADGHMRAWVSAARRLLDGDDTDVIGARDALDKALAGPCRYDDAKCDAPSWPSGDCHTCGEPIMHRVGVWVHTFTQHDTHPAVPKCDCTRTCAASLMSAAGNGGRCANNEPRYNDTDRPEGLDPATLDHSDLFNEPGSKWELEAAMLDEKDKK